MEIVAPGLLFEDGSGTYGLHNRLLVLDFAPRLLYWINLENIEEELARDHG